MGVTFEFTSKRRCLAGYCFLLWLGFTVQLNKGFTQSLPKNTIGEVKPAEVQIAIKANTENSSSRPSLYEEINNRTIQIEETHVSEKLSKYIVNCNNGEISQTNSAIEAHINDFQCHGFNFENMICKFTLPESKVHTKYQLLIHNPVCLPKNLPAECICKLENGLQQSQKICNIYKNRYRPVVKKYNFTFVAINSLGYFAQCFIVNQHKYIVPALPSVVIRNITSEGVTLGLNVQKFAEFNLLTGGLQVKIGLRPKNFEWFFINKHLTNNYEVEITDLKYSFYEYNFTVELKANNSDETMWSKKFEGEFRTRPKQPDRAPNVDVGGFFIDSIKKSIRLYWEELTEFEQNGPSFNYLVEANCNGKLMNPSLVEIDKHSALFVYKNLSECTFNLKSLNEFGTSLESSTLRIYPHEKLQNQEIIKIYNQKNRTYTIYWKQPADFNNLNNLTLFTCEAKTESKTECAGNLHFKNLNKNTLNYTISRESNKSGLNFALSQNYKTYSTGMLWAICSTNTEPKEKKIILSNTIILDSAIHLEWVTECWYSVVFKEYLYNLTYCMISKFGQECIGKAETRLIPITKNNYLIEGLQLSSSYRIWIRMVSQAEEGPSTAADFEMQAEQNNIFWISIIGVSVFIFSIYVLVRKYLKMKNIQAIFPNGVIDLNDETNKEDTLNQKEEILLQSKMSLNPSFEIVQRNFKSGGYIKMPELKILFGITTPSASVSNVIVTHRTTVQTPIDGYIKPLMNTKRYPPTLNNMDELKSGYITIKENLGGQTFKFLWIFILTLYLATSPVNGNDYVGEVIPHSVELPIGGSVNITCRMNRSYFNGHNSSCLSFYRGEGNIKVPKEHIHVVDDSSIVFMVRNASEQISQYSCKCHDKGVYITNIFVGTPPTNVTDFQCFGYDFAFMTCNFTIPHNKIYTAYKLIFWINSPDYFYDCDLHNGRQTSERICNITLDDRNNSYRIVYPYYNFELTATNTLGTLTQKILINQYNRIVPARPIIEVGNVTTNSVTLYWMVNKFSQYTHTGGLDYEIRLRPEKFDWFYINTNTSVLKNREHYRAEINNLKYAYRRYDFSVRVKTVRANNSDEKMWSEPFEGIFYTRPRRPERSPDMDVGSFYIDSNEKNIRLYWQQLAEYEENGPGFLYNITEVWRDGKLIDVKPFQMDSTSATYEWQSMSHYEFKLHSQNNVGMSLNGSTLEVHPNPKRSRQIKQILEITKVYHNQTYTITWRKPSDIGSLRNFTLFWCISKMESQSQCKGTIHFKHFDKYTTNYTTEPQNHTLNFAVSANYDGYSTGMIWALCTADGATDLTKMDPKTSSSSSHSIKVEWNTDCLYMAILEGYNLTYCEVENNDPQIIGDCINTEQTISISKLVKEYTITQLAPFTSYKISIFMYSKLKIGPMSNPVTETTTEDAPSPPRQLKKYNVTSDSVTLSWLPPKDSNGNLRYYTVWYNNKKIRVNNTSNNTENEITFQLGYLSSYSDYKVYVTAHTIEKSDPSNDIHFKTLIGIPSPPLSFIMNRNDKELFFSWSPPTLPSGRVEFYEIRVTIRKNNESEILKTSRVVGHVCKMNIPCYDPKNSYIFDARAVNIADQSEIDYHTFSKRDTSYLNTLHQGGTKKRRHSNAEINASIGAPYQIHETTDKIIRHRHERENLKQIQTTETLHATQVYSPMIDEVQEESDEDFICIGGEKEIQKILTQYKDTSQYKLFHSPWQNGPFFACSETKFSKLTILALVVIVVTMMLLAAVYYARKKYNKMSNIGLVIPEGLDDNINIPKGVDNKIERDEIIRSDELFFEKENHRLLSKVGNDSGFLNSVHCLDKSNAYACSDLQDSEKSSQSTDSVELNDITSCSYTSSPSHSPNANIRENSITEERCNPLVIQPSVQLRPSENGYIKPIMMSNGYVQPQAFQKIQENDMIAPSFNGYTTLDAMGKPMFPQTSTPTAAIPTEKNSNETVSQKNVDSKEIATPNPVSGNICGYVTHKQLSDFGRLQ